MSHVSIHPSVDGGVQPGTGKFAGGKYYNYARTGYSTKTMLVAPPGTTDACGNVWGKPAPPIGMVLNTAVVRGPSPQMKVW